MQGACGLAFLMSLGAIAASPAAAAGPSPAAGLSLEDAIKGTLRGDNININVQDEKVTSAEAAEKQARGQFDWTVHSEGGWQRLYYPRAVYGVAPNLGVLTNSTQIGSAYYTTTGVGREFRNGIQINPGVTAYPGAGATAAQTLGLTQLRPSLGLKIPLIHGLSEEAYDATEKAAKETLRGTRFDREYAIQHLVHDTVQTFWRCVASDELAEVAAESERFAAKDSANLTQLAKHGAIEPTVAQRATAISADKHVLARQTADSAQMCRRDLGLATTGSVGGVLPQAAGDLLNVDSYGPQLDSLTESAMLDLALNNRPDLKAAQRYLAAATEAHAGAEDNTSATLDVHVDYNTAFLSYTQSIENNASEGAAASAASAERQALLTFRQLQTQAQVDIADTLRNLRQAYSDSIAVDKAEHQMEAALADSEKMTKFGTSDHKDLLLAHDQLTDLQNQLVTARLLFASSLATLRLVTGTIDPDDESPARIADEFRTLPIRG
jgi:outer membrane protein TolC